MGDINRVQPVVSASLGGLPEARVNRQEDPRKHDHPQDQEPKSDDVIEIGGVIEEVPQVVPEPDFEHLDLTA